MTCSLILLLATAPGAMIDTWTFMSWPLSWNLKEGITDLGFRGEISNVTVPISILPVLHPRRWRVMDIGGTPNFEVNKGSRTWSTYSIDGELLTLVPPSMVTRSGTPVRGSFAEMELEKRRYGSMAWRIKVIAPGEAMDIRVSRRISTPSNFTSFQQEVSLFVCPSGSPPCRSSVAAVIVVQLGRKTNSLLFASIPCVSAFVASASHCTPAR